MPDYGWIMIGVGAVLVGLVFHALFIGYEVWKENH